MNIWLLEEAFNDILPFKGETFMSKHRPSLGQTHTSYRLVNEKDKAVYTAAALGLDKEDIDMSFKNKHLIVKSKKDKTNSSLLSTLNHSLYVGDDVDKDSIKASLERGILTIEIPFKENKQDFSIKF